MEGKREEEKRLDELGGGGADYWIPKVFPLFLSLQVHFVVRFFFWFFCLFVFFWFFFWGGGGGGREELHKALSKLNKLVITGGQRLICKARFFASLHS